MRLKKSIYVTMVTASLLGTAVMADSGFPAGFPAGVSDVSIGDTLTYIEPIVRGLLSPDIETIESELVRAGAIQRRGTVFSSASVRHPISGDLMQIAFGGSEAGEIVSSSFQSSYRYDGSALSVIFSSPATGGGVEAIVRYIKYDAPLDADAVDAKLRETYGDPVERGLGRTYLWAFKDGVPLDTVPAKCLRPSSSPRFLDWDTQSHILKPASYLRSHFEGRQGAFGEDMSALSQCDAALEVRPRYDENDEVVGIRFLILDHLKMRQDQDALLAEIAAENAAVEAAGPKGATEVEDF